MEDIVDVVDNPRGYDDDDDDDETGDDEDDDDSFDVDKDDARKNARSAKPHSKSQEGEREQLQHHPAHGVNFASVDEVEATLREFSATTLFSSSEISSHGKKNLNTNYESVSDVSFDEVAEEEEGDDGHRGWTAATSFSTQQRRIDSAAASLAVDAVARGAAEMVVNEAVGQAGRGLDERRQLTAAVSASLAAAESAEGRESMRGGGGRSGGRGGGGKETTEDGEWKKAESFATDENQDQLRPKHVCPCYQVDCFSFYI